jgi:hypothetical protein
MSLYETFVAGVLEAGRIRCRSFAEGSRSLMEVHDACRAEVVRQRPTVHAYLLSCHCEDAHSCAHSWAVVRDWKVQVVELTTFSVLGRQQAKVPSKAVVGSG